MVAQRLTTADRGTKRLAVSVSSLMPGINAAARYSRTLRRKCCSSPPCGQGAHDERPKQFYFLTLVAAGSLERQRLGRSGDRRHDDVRRSQGHCQISCKPLLKIEEVRFSEVRSLRIWTAVVLVDAYNCATTMAASTSISSGSRRPPAMRSPSSSNGHPTDRSVGGFLGRRSRARLSHRLCGALRLPRLMQK